MLALPLTLLDLSAHLAWLLLLVALAGVYLVLFVVGILVALVLSRR